MMERVGGSALTILVACTILLFTEAAWATTYPICPEGTYVAAVPLLPEVATSESIVVSPPPSGSPLTVDIGCSDTRAPKNDPKFSIKGTKKGTKVKARWKVACGGQLVTLAAVIDPSCQTMQGKVKQKGIKAREFSSSLLPPCSAAISDAQMTTGIQAALLGLPSDIDPWGNGEDFARLLKTTQQQLGCSITGGSSPSAPNSAFPRSLLQGCTPSADYHLLVQYCGPGTSTDNPWLYLLGPTCVNPCCDIHDGCYGASCANGGLCSFAQNIYAPLDNCDSALIAGCDECALPLGLGYLTKGDSFVCNYIKSRKLFAVSGCDQPPCEDPTPFCDPNQHTCVDPCVGVSCDDGNPCTLDQCDGTSALCQNTPGNAGVTCRPSTAGCDAAETCTGSSPDCPTDVNNCCIPTEPGTEITCNDGLDNDCDGLIDIADPSCQTTGRYLDNGDGTVTDTQTGLQWEKKTTTVGSGENYADPHDVDNSYTWSTGPPWNQDGTAFTDFLVKLNTVPCFAGHCDWRLPSEGGCNSCYTGYPSYSCPCGPNELESILLAPYPCGTYPCIDSIFGPTVAGYYWSATTSAYYPSYAWLVFFSNGFVDYSLKDGNSYVRAVRTGS